MDSFDWCTCGFTNTLMIWKVYVNLANIGDCDLKRTARVEIHNFFNLLPCTIFGHNLMCDYLYYARCLSGDNS